MGNAAVVQEVLSGSILVSVLVICTGYPDLSHDYRVIEADLDPLYREYINAHREMTDGMPRVCRKDICYKQSTYDVRKGDFHWPEIIAGQQVELRCPFSFVHPVYTIRMCTVDSHGLAIWNKKDIKNCPDPPLAELLRELDYEYNYIHPDNWTLYYQDLLSRVVQVFTLYRDTPMKYTDIKSLTMKLKQVIPKYKVTGDILCPDTMQDYLTVMDTLMDDDFRSYFDSAIHSNSYEMSFREDLGRLPHLLMTPSEEDPSYVMNNLAMYTITMKSSGDTMLNISQGFHLQVNENVTVQSPFVALKILNRGSEEFAHFSTSILSLTLLKYSYLFTRNAKWMQTSTDEEEDENWSFLNGTLKKNTRPKSEFISSFDSLGSLILLMSDTDNVDFSKDVQILYSSHTCDVTEDQCLVEEPSCVHSMYDTWSGEACKVIETLNTDGFTTCLCQGTGAFAIFVQISSTDSGKDREFSLILESKIIEGDISLFLGFPYKRELEILGTVLGSLSLACLLVTLASYAIFQRSRKGSPTTILVNLCVALTILSSLLLIVQYMGDIMSRTGCTVCNVLRYYLVFVSLMWNAVEAFNMYLMLLRVFDSRVRRFAMKAGAIAWGIPLLMVAVCFGVNKKSFNGHFVITSEQHGECAFKCQLNKRMLHYAYLIPLSVIILHNLIIFGFVLRTIIKHGQKLGQNKKRNHMVQLVGAVATLVLLGVPWVFSAFGAIDASTNYSLIMVQGIFQVVFVIFVNLQGCFIFAFHCARNAQIRQSWKSAVRSLFTVTNTSTMVTSTNNSPSESVKHKERVTENTDTIQNVATIDPELKKNSNGEFDKI